MNKVNIIPMAGEGKRFSDKGYLKAKPFLHVNDTPMFIVAAKSLPYADKYIFICSRIHEKTYQINTLLKKNFNKFEIIFVDELTDGQARTCMMAETLLSKDDVISIGPCDSYFEYSNINYNEKLINNDVIIWSFQNKLTLENPSMFGWIKIDSNEVVTEIKCKEPISLNPENDNAVVGAFTFKSKKFFIKSLESMFKKKRMINKEFYLDIAIDEAVKNGYKVSMMKTNKFFSFGTPKEYEKNKFF